MVQYNGYLGKFRIHEHVSEQPITVYKRNHLALNRETDTVVMHSTYADFDHSGEKCTYKHFNVAFQDLAACPYGMGRNIAENGSIKLIDRLLHGTHSIPGNSCTCGFYGYFDIEEAYNHFNRDKSRHNNYDTFIFEVAVSGKYIAFDRGYRFAKQRVKNVIIDDCGTLDCGNPADRLKVYGDYPAESRFAGQINPTCIDHISRWSSNDDYLSFTELETYINKARPAGIPYISVRSYYKEVDPWERKISPLLSFFKPAAMNSFRLLLSV